MFTYQPSLQNPFDYTNIKCSPTSASSTNARYLRTLKTMTNFSGDYLSQMGNWVRESLPEPLSSVAAEAV